MLRFFKIDINKMFLHHAYHLEVRLLDQYTVLSLLVHDID